MSAIFFKRFLKRPMQVASIIPSSKALVERVGRRLDLSEPRVIVELGPGEGVHTRAIASRLKEGSRMLLFELDPELADYLKEQFRGDDRIEVLNADAQELHSELRKRGCDSCDYVLSGIPFSILEINKKRALLQNIFDSLKPEPHAAFVIYQVTAELRQHTKMFPRVQQEYCLQNIPPMFVISFFKMASPDAKIGGGNGSRG